MEDNNNKKLTLLEKVCQIQGAVVEKNKKVDFTVKGRRVKYDYTNLDDIIAVVTPALKNLGLVMSSGIVFENSTHYVKTVLMDVGSSEKLESIYPILTNFNNPQDIGSIVTYAKRYNISMILNLSGTFYDDDASYLNNIIPEDNKGDTEKKQPKFSKVYFIEEIKKAPNEKSLVSIWKTLTPELQDELKGIFSERKNIVNKKQK